MDCWEDVEVDNGGGGGAGLTDEDDLRIETSSSLTSNGIALKGTDNSGSIPMVETAG